MERPSGIEGAVVEQLQEDWRDVLRCTTIDQAMERLGIPFSHAERLRVAEILREKSHELSGMRWPLSTYVLTNPERLVARHVLRASSTFGEIPPPRALAEKLGTEPETAEQAYEALSWLGFLVPGERGWRLADDFGRFLGGLGFHFHEVVLPERGERFNTNCAMDFFILTHPPTRARALAQLEAGDVPELSCEDGMSPAMIEALRSMRGQALSAFLAGGFYEGERALLNDACGWSDEPIRVVIERGKLAEVSPESTWYLRGGG